MGSCLVTLQKDWRLRVGFKERDVTLHSHGDISPPFIQGNSSFLGFWNFLPSEVRPDIEVIPRCSSWLVRCHPRIEPRTLRYNPNHSNHSATETGQKFGLRTAPLSCCLRYLLVVATTMTLKLQSQSFWDSFVSDNSFIRGYYLFDPGDLERLRIAFHFNTA